jgi:hypothetical protein
LSATFLTSELEYLAGQHLGRIATIQPDGTLQVSPVVFRDNPVLGSVHATEYVRDEFAPHFAVLRQQHGDTLSPG